MIDRETRRSCDGCTAESKAINRIQGGLDKKPDFGLRRLRECCTTPVACVRVQPYVQCVLLCVRASTEFGRQERSAQRCVLHGAAQCSNPPRDRGPRSRRHKPYPSLVHRCGAAGAHDAACRYTYVRVRNILRIGANTVRCAVHGAKS